MVVDEKHCNIQCKCFPIPVLFTPWLINSHQLFLFADRRLVNKQRGRREPPGAGRIHSAAHSGLERGRYGGGRPAPGRCHRQHER